MTTTCKDRPAEARPDDLIAITRRELHELRMEAFRAGMLAQAAGATTRRPLAAIG